MTKEEHKKTNPAPYEMCDWNRRFTRKEPYTKEEYSQAQLEADDITRWNQQGFKHKPYTKTEHKKFVKEWYEMDCWNTYSPDQEPYTEEEIRAFMPNKQNVSKNKMLVMEIETDEECLCANVKRSSNTEVKANTRYLVPQIELPDEYEIWNEQVRNDNSLMAYINGDWVTGYNGSICGEIYIQPIQEEKDE